MHKQPFTSTKETKTTQHKPPIAVAAIATIIVLFALAFKKGYITIETVDEETPQKNISV